MSVWHKQARGDGDIWVVGASGRLDQNLNPRLEETLNQILADGHFHVLVDLQEVTYINSSGLRCLVSAWRRAREQDGNLVLCGLSGRLHEIFTMVGFDRVFNVYAGQADALNAMRP